MNIQALLSMLTPSNPALFKSRKFWVAVIGLMFDVAVIYVPEFEPFASEMILSCTVIVGVLINGYAKEDEAIAAQTGKRNPKYTGGSPTAADWKEVAPK